MTSEELDELNDMVRVMAGSLQLVVADLTITASKQMKLREALMETKDLFVFPPNGGLVQWDVRKHQVVTASIEDAAEHFRGLSIRLRTLSGTLQAINSFAHQYAQEATHGQEDQRGGVQSGAEATAELSDSELPHKDQE